MMSDANWYVMKVLIATASSRFEKMIIFRGLLAGSPQCSQRALLSMTSRKLYPSSLNISGVFMMVAPDSASNSISRYSLTC
jgi:hypothetical protein